MCVLSLWVKFCTSNNEIKNINYKITFRSKEKAREGKSEIPKTSTEKSKTIEEERELEAEKVKAKKSKFILDSNRRIKFY